MSPHMLQIRMYLHLFKIANFQAMYHLLKIASIDLHVVYLVARVLVSMEVMESLPSSSASPTTT